MTIDPSRLRRIEELYHLASERQPDERNAFLAEACAGDAALLREMGALLAQHPSSGLLDRPVLELAAGLLHDSPSGRWTTGTQVGPYRIVSRLGEGGMGEVFRASDTRLGREVAVKTAHHEFTGRFQREARLISSLNHPNICTLHDVGPDYLVMELIEGADLSGPLPIATALNYARQIAAGLETAHEKGIVHRDLKPANIKVTSEGIVKILDFGLAKAAAGPTDAADPAGATARTGEGAVLGTAAYMAPEQLRGEPAGKRADIWAFGLVLWELLTGRRLFDTPSVPAALAEVLHKEIDFAQLPAGTPPAIQTLLHRCLDRDVKSRLRDIGEARVAIDAAARPAPSPRMRFASRAPFAWIVAAVFALALATLAIVHFREAPEVRPHVRFQLDAPAGELADFQISPDGEFLVFTTGAGSSSRKVWIRPLDNPETRLLTGIEGLRYFRLFWSRDSEHLVFQLDDKLYRIHRNGGPHTLIADAPGQILGGVVLDGGDILIGTRDGLYHVPASSRAAVRIEDQSAEFLAWLPGRRFLYTRADGVYAGSLDGVRPFRLLSDAGSSAYVPPSSPDSPGHLLFVRDRTLLAQPFDPEKLAFRGDPVPAATGVGRMARSEKGAFTASTNGILVHGHGGDLAPVVLTWFDRAGRKLQTAGQPFHLAPNPAIRLSPDDSRALVPINAPDGTGQWWDQVDQWIVDFHQNNLSRFTFNGSRSAIWSPDGRKVLWAANDHRRYLRSADGSGKDELIFSTTVCDDCFLNDWSADGKLIAFAEGGRKALLDIWLVPLAGDRKPFPYLQSGFATYWAQISPDSRWIVYGLDQAPQPTQIFLESIPTGKGRWQISTEGGDWPVWRRDGKELFYRQRSTLMAVPMRLNPTSVEIGKPQRLFDLPPGNTRFQVSRDGQRFLLALPAGSASTSSSLTVDTDWRAGLPR